MSRHQEMLDDKRSFERAMLKKANSPAKKKGGKPFTIPPGIKMTKHNYLFRRHLEKGLPQMARKCCDDFNYANDALKFITGKKQKFD